MPHRSRFEPDLRVCYGFSIFPGTGAVRDGQPLHALGKRYPGRIRRPDSRDRRRVGLCTTQTAEIGACVWKELMPQPNVVGIIANLLLYIGE